ncbi:MAG: hypothetical protein AAGF36_01495 [Pseudomonadota bacterium]
MNQKRQLFEGFHNRMTTAVEKKFYLEASWYAYAIIEDRLVSMLRQSGGVGRNGSSSPIRMLGKKVSELETRANTDDLLRVNLPAQDIYDWAAKRNTLMHAMAEGTLDQAEIDKQAYLLAVNGRDLVRQVSDAAMRIKKHRSKIQ